MEKDVKKPRTNIHFRQTPKEFRSAKQAQIWSHINRNLPYSLLSFTKGKLYSAFSLLKGRLTKISFKLPKEAKKVR